MNANKMILEELITHEFKLSEINNALEKLEEEIPDFEYESAMIFAKKRKLGKFGKLRVILENNPSSNPKTSRLTAMSIILSLNKRKSSFLSAF